MFGINDSYYNQSLKKLVIGFGTLFNEIYIQRLTSTNAVKERIRVPLTYAPKEKFVNRMLADGGRISESTKIEIALPVIGFQISGIVYDPTRKLNKLKTVFSETSETLSSMWSEVPYNVSFSLYVFTRTIDDNLQIVEQILPNFTPDFTISMRYNALNTSVDIPIILNTIQTTEDYEGSFDTRRSVISSFTFTAKTYIYGKIKESTAYTIEDVDVNFYDELTKPDHYVSDLGWTGDADTGTIIFRP